MTHIFLIAAAAAALLLPSSALAQAAPAGPSPQSAIAGTAGTWRGELQYRDYQTNRWQGLPMTVAIVSQPDGVTTVRTARYDDGPQTGIVTITTATLVDPVAATIDYAILRKARATDTGQARIERFTPGADATHWTLVTMERRKDGEQTAQVRETTVRDGFVLTTLKEVNPDGDGTEDWLPRNRTVLTTADGSSLRHRRHAERKTG